MSEILYMRISTQNIACSQCQMHTCIQPSNKAVEHTLQTYAYQEPQRRHIPSLPLFCPRQLEQLNTDQPDKPVMLAVFGSEVDVKGGGEFTSSSTNSKFSNCDRATHEELINKGKELAANYRLKPLSESFV